MPENDIKYIINNRNIDTYFFTKGVGYAKLDGLKNESKPYLYLMEYDEDALKKYGIVLEEGRLPENENEVIISKHIETNGNVKLKVGDTLSIDVGQRMLNGKEVDQKTALSDGEMEIDEDGKGFHYQNVEKIVNTKKMNFKIVGIMKRPSYNVEEYSAPGYTIITKMNDTKDKKVNISFSVKKIKDVYDIIKNIEGVDNLDDIYKETAKYKIFVNTDLIMWYGVTRSEGVSRVLYTLLAIVLGIIVFASVFVIRNGFAISVSERMKQIGMIKSVGATKKQIKKSVLFEGVIIGLIRNSNRNTMWTFSNLYFSNIYTNNVKRFSYE